MPIKGIWFDTTYTHVIKYKDIDWWSGFWTLVIFLKSLSFRSKRFREFSFINKWHPKSCSRYEAMKICSPFTYSVWNTLSVFLHQHGIRKAFLCFSWAAQKLQLVGWLLMALPPPYRPIVHVLLKPLRNMDSCALCCPRAQSHLRDRQGRLQW